MLSIRIFALVLLSQFAISCYSNAAIIDSFTVGAFDQIKLRGDPRTTYVQANLAANQVIGGRREVTFEAIGPPPNGSGGAHLIVNTALGNFQYDADAGYSAANFSITYRGASNDLHANLSADGSNTLVLDFAFAQFETGGGAFDITVDTEPGGRYLYVPVANSATPFSLALPFKAFNLSSSAANFAHVVRIDVGTSNGNLRGDFTLNAIRTAYFRDGDYNFDGSVNGLDYQVWKSHYGKTGPYQYYPVDPADGNRNGIVDAADYTIWRNNRSSTASGTLLPSVPEPSSICLGLLVLAASIKAVRLRPTAMPCQRH